MRNQPRLCMVASIAIINPMTDMKLQYWRMSSRKNYMATLLMTRSLIDSTYASCHQICKSDELMTEAVLFS